MWLLFAFSGPVLWAASTHIDKYLVDKYFKNANTAILMVFTALIGLLMLPFILFYKPGTLSLPLSSIVVMAASGALYVWAMLFYLRAIQSEEASVVAPLFQASVIFTFILGYLFLGETISPVNALGVALIIFGALILSFQSGSGFRGFKKSRLIFLMLAATFVLALSTVIFKFFAVREDFWSTTFWVYAGEALFGAGILAVPGYFRQFIKLIKENTSALLAINGANELINLGGGLGVRFASLLAPVVLISAISSTTTLFVFLFGIILTFFFPKIAQENVSAANLFQKGAAALIVAAGVTLANL